VAAPEQELVARRIRDEAAACGDHCPLVLVQHAFQGAALEAPVGVLAVHREYLAERGAGFLFHLTVELDERHAERVCELLAERGLACAAQANQGHARGARQSVFAHQVLDGDAHRARHAAQEEDRDIAAARLELREVALGDPGGGGERAARHAVLGAPGAHPLAKAAKVEGFLRFAGEGRVHEI
jgi:hypothetical protein